MRMICPLAASRGILLVLFSLAACPAWPKPLRPEPVRVSAAMSLKDALTDVARVYKADGRGEVEFTFGSSGHLEAQIEFGAAADVFVSAAHKQVDELVKAGCADGATRRVIAGNSLVLVGPAVKKTSLAGLKNLGDASVRRLSIGEPKTVPAGQYAMQVLSEMKLAEALAGRLVYGANVRQVLDYVERGEVDAGIVYATDARESGDRVRVIESADPRTHDPIEYLAVVSSNSDRQRAAREFIDYLASEKSREILTRRGFTIPARRPRE